MSENVKILNYTKILLHLTFGYISKQIDGMPNGPNYEQK
jgi:hypothetical protein